MTEPELDCPPLFPAELIDRARCTTTPAFRRRLRDRVSLHVGDIAGPSRLVTVALTLWTARTDGRRPPGDDDELELSVLFVERWHVALRLLVPLRWATWLNEHGVTRQ